MTSTSAPRPGQDPSDPPRESDQLRPGDVPPSEAVTLADLIADAGPLPADAALECVQRLAERLTLTPCASCATLGPADVLIDDDGGVWLKPARTGLPDGPASAPPQGLDRLGHLLAFLATGNGSHFADGSAVATTDLPAPLSNVAGRLFSRNGACYRSYAELANDAAVLRGVASPLVSPAPVAAPVPVVEEPTPEPVAELAEVESVTTVTPVEAQPVRESIPQPTEGETSSGLLGIGMIVAAAAGAAIAYVVWQAL